MGEYAVIVVFLFVRFWVYNCFCYLIVNNSKPNVCALLVLLDKEERGVNQEIQREASRLFDKIGETSAKKFRKFKPKQPQCSKKKPKEPQCTPLDLLLGNPPAPPAPETPPREIIPPPRCLHKSPPRALTKCGLSYKHCGVGGETYQTEQNYILIVGVLTIDKTPPVPSLPSPILL